MNIPEIYLKNVPDSENVLEIKPFHFTLIVNGTVGDKQASANIFADSDFLCISLGANGDVNNLLSLTIRDASTNWPLMEKKVRASSIFGSGTLPYFLPIPWFFIAKSSIVIDATITGGNIPNTELVFSGYRIFRK